MRFQYTHDLQKINSYQYPVYMNQSNPVIFLQLFKNPGAGRALF